MVNTIWRANANKCTRSTYIVSKLAFAAVGGGGGGVESSSEGQVKVAPPCEPQVHEITVG